MRLDELKINFNKEKKELTIKFPGLGVWIAQALAAIRRFKTLKRQKKELEVENAKLDALIAMVDAAKDEADIKAVLKKAEEYGIDMPAAAIIKRKETK